MAEKTITAFNGVPVGPSHAIDITIQSSGGGTPSSTAPQPSWQIEMVQRRNRRPRRGNAYPQAVAIPIHITMPDKSTQTQSEYANAVTQMFDPLKGPYWMQGIAEDGATPIQILVDVQAKPWIAAKGYKHYQCTLLAAEDSWQSINARADSSSPLVVYGPGHVYPTITITPSGTTVKRKRVTITDNTGRGLVNHPILITFDSTGVSATAATNYIVFVGPRSVPFNVATLNNASTKLWVRVDVPPPTGTPSTATVDIYYGSSVSNSATSNTYIDGGMSLTLSSNSDWVWDTMAVSVNPVTTGAWRPGLQGPTPFGALSQTNSAYEVSESSTSVEFETDNTTDFGMVANAMILDTGVEADTLKDLSRTSALNTGFASFIRYRTVNGTWQDGWSSTANSTVTTDTTVTDAIQIAVGVDAKTSDSRSLTISPLGNTDTTFQLTFQSGSVPTVSVASAITAYVINATLIITNPDATTTTITFNTVYLDGALVIDCDSHAVTPTNGVMKSPNATGIQMSDRDNLCVLMPGKTTWVNATNSAAAFSWHERFGIA